MICLEKIIDTVGEYSVNDEVNDDIIFYEPFTHKEILISPRTLNNFLVLFEKTTTKYLDPIKKVRDELHLDLNFNKKYLNFNKKYYNHNSLNNLRYFYNFKELLIYNIIGTIYFI